MQVLQWIVNLGASVFLPILLFLFGLLNFQVKCNDDNEFLIVV
jgi:galactitol-specific phosphotransferase system IIC component